VNTNQPEMKQHYPSKVVSAGKSFLLAFIIVLIGGILVTAIAFEISKPNKVYSQNGITAKQPKSQEQIEKLINQITFISIGIGITSTIVYVKACFDLIGSAKE
jgi:hypothetical protein